MRIFLSITLFFALKCLHAQSLEEFYDEFISPHIQSGVIDYASLAEDKSWVYEAKKIIAETPWRSMSDLEQKAYLINTYNTLVIAEITLHYPFSSVQDIKGFFSSKHDVGGEKFSLDAIEKKLLNPAKDPRLHMVLVCGAISCPPLREESFKSHTLESDLDEAVKKALYDTRILRMSGEEQKMYLSQLFRWYATDFGSIKKWLEQYMYIDVMSEYVIEYTVYNWMLNSKENAITLDDVQDKIDSDLRYYVSNLYGKGEYEIMMFNNYFREVLEQKRRNDFFTSFTRLTYGINKRINLIMELKVRSVSFGDTYRLGFFDALRFSTEGSSINNGREVTFRNAGVSAIIPRIKYQPFHELSTLTFQTGIAIPTQFEGQGGFLDWGSPSIYHDVFYDQDIGAKSSIFFQMGIWIENIGGSFFRKRDGFYQFSTPLTFIYQYFPNRNTTLFALVNSAPQWGYSVSNSGRDIEVIPDSYSQYGIGIKQFVSSKLQLEVLVSSFHTSRFQSQAATYNFAIRYYHW